MRRRWPAKRSTERLVTARKYLDDFGVGAYCGFGRVPAEQLSWVLDEHA